MKNVNTSLNSLKLNKDTIFSQKKIIYQYLKTHLATATMISKATGIPEKNICRRKRELEKAGVLWKIERKLCKSTGYKAWYLTTNPDLANNSLTLNTK